MTFLFRNEEIMDDWVLIDGKLVGRIEDVKPTLQFQLFYRPIKWYEWLWYHTWHRLCRWVAKLFGG